MDKGNIKIAGSGFINSGEYEEIKIMGTAKSEGHVKADIIKVMGGGQFKGDMTCGICTIHGGAHFTGNIKMKQLKINGEFHVEGNCEVEELVVNGSSRIIGSMNCGRVVLRGGLHIDKSCKAQEIKVYGTVHAHSDFSAERIMIEGKIDCEGLLNAEYILIHPTAESHCKEIGTAELTIERPIYHILWLSYHKKTRMICDLIEGDELKLENVICKKMRGRNITLDEHCNINELEYTSSLTKEEGAVVKEETKID